MMKVPVVPRRSGWDDLIYHLSALPRRSGWEISDTKMGAETKLLPALCPVANLLFRIVFSMKMKVEVKNLPIRRKVVDGAKPINIRPGGYR